MFFLPFYWWLCCGKNSETWLLSSLQSGLIFLLILVLFASKKILERERGKRKIQTVFIDTKESLFIFLLKIVAWHPKAKVWGREAASHAWRHACMHAQQCSVGRDFALQCKPHMFSCCSCLIPLLIVLAHPAHLCLPIIHCKHLSASS